MLRRLELARAETLRGSHAVNSGHALAVALLEEPDLPDAELGRKLDGLDSIAALVASAGLNAEATAFLDSTTARLIQILLVRTEWSKAKIAALEASQAGLVEEVRGLKARLAVAGLPMKLSEAVPPLSRHAQRAAPEPELRAGPEPELGPEPDPQAELDLEGEPEVEVERKREPEPEPEPEPDQGEQSWDEYSDEETGHMYYVNRKTSETVWDPPPGWNADQ